MDFQQVVLTYMQIQNSEIDWGKVSLIKYQILERMALALQVSHKTN